MYSVILKDKRKDAINCKELQFRKDWLVLREPIDDPLLTDPKNHIIYIRDTEVEQVYRQIESHESDYTDNTKYRKSWVDTNPSRHG